jgi:hypothetical protein
MTSTAVRRWHAYIGLTIAPSVIFLALTGAVQLFSLHEAHGDYRPAALIEQLSSVHKDQVLKPHHAHQHEAAGAAAGAEDEAEEQVPVATLALKCFLLLVAISLTVSTALGVWMGFTQLKRPRLAWTLLLAGLAIPCGLLALT